MSDWREQAKRGEWECIDCLSLPKADQQELLGQIRKVVPTEEIRNGMQVMYRHYEPSELDDPKLKQAANILMLGELEAAVDVFLEDSLHEWEHIQDRIFGEVSILSQAGEKTQGHEVFSRSYHLDELQTYLCTIESNFVRLEEPPSEYDIINDRRSESKIAKEDFAGGILLGMKIAEHLQLAKGKDIETLAVEKLSNKKRLESQAKLGGEITSGRFKELAKILNDFALSEENLGCWAAKNTRETLSAFKKMATALEARSEKELKYSSSKGKILSDDWFLKRVTECRDDSKCKSFVLKQRAKEKS